MYMFVVKIKLLFNFNVQTIDVNSFTSRYCRRFSYGFFVEMVFFVTVLDYVFAAPRDDHPCVLDVATSARARIPYTYVRTFALCAHSVAGDVRRGARHAREPNVCHWARGSRSVGRCQSSDRVVPCALVVV